MSDNLLSPEWNDPDFVERQRQLRALCYAGPERTGAEEEGTPLPGSLDPSILMRNTVAFMEAEKQGKRQPSSDASTFAERRAAAEQKAREKERREAEERNRIQAIESRASLAMWQCWLTGAACLTWRSAVVAASGTLLPSAKERILRSCVQLRQAAKQALAQSVPFASSLGLPPERIAYETECFCLHFEHGSMIGSFGAGAFDSERHGDTSAYTPPLSQWCHNRPPEPQGTQAEQTGQGGLDHYAAAPVRGDICQR